MPGERKSVYIYPPAIEEIQSRGAISEIINRDLERLYTLYKRNLPTLTLPEASLICDVLNGTIMDANSAPLIYAEVEDGCRLNGLDEKWGADGTALVAKLHALSDVQCLALVDAAEKFWEKHDQDNFEDLIRGIFKIA